MFFFEFDLLFCAIALFSRWVFSRKGNGPKKAFIDPFWADAKRSQGDRGTSVLVTGGTGVLGWRVVCHAKERWPSANIVVFDINKVSPERKVERVSYVYGDVTDEMDVVYAFAQTFVNDDAFRIVFHVAGLLPSCSTTRKNLQKVNGAGAKTIVKLSQHYRVDCLVSTSSASVVLPKSNTFLDGVVGETMPYPASDNFVDDYAASKAAGEQYVLDANGSLHECDGDELPSKLATACIRPSIVYAFDDKKFAERLLNGEINYIFGDGKYAIDFVWCEDVAKGHVDAAVVMLSEKNSRSGESSVSGKAFHLGAGVSQTAEEFYSCSAWGNKAPQKIPLCFMRALAWLNFLVFQWVGQAPVDHFLRPDSFNFMAGRTWWFSVEEAKRAFAYTPTPLRNAIGSMKEMKEEIEVDPNRWYNQ